MSDYPSGQELDAVREYPVSDAKSLTGWLAYVKSIGNYWPDASFGWSEELVAEDGRTVHRYHVSTGGWSGNEDILSAMQENHIAWTMTWQQTRRGGHFIFEVRHA